MLLRINFLFIFVVMIFSSGAFAKNAAPYSITIPDIDTVVSNINVNVKLDSSWNLPASDQVTYTLQGNTSSGGWTNLFGSGPQANTPVSLSTSETKNIRAVFPVFSGQSTMTKYRLLFMVNQGGGTYGMLGTIPLKNASVDNSGSIAGNTYTLKYQPQGPVELTPDSPATNAIKTPVNPPQIATYKGRKVFQVFDESQGKYVPFFVRGMDYEPTPVGQPWTENGDPVTAKGEPVHLADFNKNGGGQICQPLPAGPYGTPNQSYCFDTDLTGPMHQYLNNSPLAGADAANNLLPQRWQKDLAMLQAMGVNTLRIYHIDALVRDMTDFLDMAYRYGIYVIMPAPAPNTMQTFESSPATGSLLSWSQMTSSTTGQPWSALMQLALAKYAAHPAILAWAVGNETMADNGNDAAAEIEWVLAKTIKQFDSNLLVTATNQDHYNSADNFKAYYKLFDGEKNTNYLDFYSINSYRGMNNSGLQLSGMQTLLDLHASLSSPYDLPLLISEWGKYDTYDWGDFDNKWGFNRLWRMFLLNQSNVLGVAYFEFSDEPVAKNLAEQHYMGVVAYKLPANYSNNNPIVVDEIQPKYSDYTGIKVGTAPNYYQNYPAVKQAGVFDSFIGDNTNPLTQDTNISQIPNISWCAFSQSTAPWNIHSLCTSLDVSINKVTGYSIAVAFPASNSVATLKLNGKTISGCTSGTGTYTCSSLKETGTIEIQLQKTGGGQGWTKLGFSALQQIPKESNNTLLNQNLSGEPVITWSGNTSVAVSLPGVN